MKLSDYLRAQDCILALRSTAKQEAIAEIVDRLALGGGISSGSAFLEAIVARERLGSTGIGRHVAIPHAPTGATNELVIGFGRSPEGIEFNAIDGEKVNLVFLLGANPRNLTMYVKLLAKLATLLNDESFRKELIAASTPDAVIDIIKRWETEHNGGDV